MVKSFVGSVILHQLVSNRSQFCSFVSQVHVAHGVSLRRLGPSTPHMLKHTGGRLLGEALLSDVLAKQTLHLKGLASNLLAMVSSQIPFGIWRNQPICEGPSEPHVGEGLGAGMHCVGSRKGRLSRQAACHRCNDAVNPGSNIVYI